MSLFGANFGLEVIFIVPFSFENVAGQTIIDVRYRDTIIQFFCALQNMNMDDTWFQQVGAMCHIVQKIIRLLHELLFGRIIFRFIN